MHEPSQDFCGNILLRSLPGDTYELVRPHLERVEVEHGQVLIEPNEKISHVWFPEGGVVSTVAVGDAREQTEVGISGYDGAVGLPLFLGADRSPQSAYVQIDGSPVLRMEREAFRSLFDGEKNFRTPLLRYVQTFLIQVAQTNMANAHDTTAERLARWLLMCHDRVDGDELRLTHQFLGIMLAARRSGVTLATHELEGEGMIRAKRGLITITDRAAPAELRQHGLWRGGSGI